MSRITKRLETLKAQGKKALIIYLTAGCPSEEATVAAVKAAAEAGADIIEIGIPFSDPMADGPVIQKAATIALQGGMTTKRALNLVERIRKESEVPLAVMTYYNTVLNYGLEGFIRDFSKAGIDGIIVPDLPFEEGKEARKAGKAEGMDVIAFLALTTSDNRAEQIAKEAAGFIYCVSTTGVTGVREVDYSSIGRVMKAARPHTNLPMAIGFGIGSGSAACQAAKYADAVIVGSAIMEQLQKNGIFGMTELVKSLRQALDEGESLG